MIVLSTVKIRYLDTFANNVALIVFSDILFYYLNSIQDCGVTPNNELRCGTYCHDITDRDFRKHVLYCILSSDFHFLNPTY